MSLPISTNENRRDSSGLNNAGYSGLKPDEILIKTVAAGYCHGDFMIQNLELGAEAGELPTGGTGLPMIPFHEGAGVIVHVGSGIDPENFKACSMQLEPSNPRRSMLKRNNILDRRPSRGNGVQRPLWNVFRLQQRISKLLCEPEIKGYYYKRDSCWVYFGRCLVCHKTSWRDRIWRGGRADVRRWGLLNW